MKTLNQFLIENNCSKLELMQLNGRAFATVGDKQLVASKSCDFAKPLFVTPLSKFNNGIDATEGSTEVPNAFVMMNSAAEIVFTFNITA